MNIKLVFAIENANLANKYSEELQGCEEITVLNKSSRELIQMNIVDAIFISTMAGERFGAVPRVHQCQVLETRDNAGWPPYIVAGVALKRDEDPSDVRVSLPIVMRSVIEAVDHFNLVQHRIETVGFGAEWIGLDKAIPEEASKTIISICSKA